MNGGCIYRTEENRCRKFTTGTIESWCVGDEPCEYRTKSRADILRSMTDEELAEWLTGTFYLERKEGMTFREIERIWLEWLKQAGEDQK